MLSFSMMKQDSELIDLFMHIALVVTRQSDQVLLEQLGIGISQYRILSLLKGSVGMSQANIAKGLGQTEASISRQIKLLVNHGLVVSQPCPSNRRTHIISLTPKGARHLEGASQILAKHQSTTCASLSEKQQVQLVDILGKLHENVCLDLH